MITNPDNMVEAVARMTEADRDAFITTLVNKWPDLAITMADQINWFTIDEDKEAHG